MPKIDKNDIAVVILAGGQANRMQGQDKGMMPLAGKPLISHVLERLTPQTDNIIISANRQLSEYSKLGFPVVPDQFIHYPGPLAGIEAAMHVIDGNWLLTVPCDAPLLATDYVARMTDHNGQARAYVAEAAGDRQPGFSLWNVSTHNMIRAALQSQQRAVHRLLEQLNAVHINFDDADNFININSLEELQQYEQQ